jgi:hypothetical protein
MRRRWRYAQRGPVQILAAAAGLGVAAIILLGLAWYFRSAIRHSPFAAFGLALSVGYVVLRVVSFHHIDQLLSFRLGGPKLLHYVELAAIMLIAVDALRLYRKTKASR